MGAYSIVIHDFISPTDYTITFTSGSTDRVLGRVYAAEENHPAHVVVRIRNDSSVASDNLLSSSYAGWSGAHTAAVAVGQELEYYLTATDLTTGAPGSSVSYFRGPITKISQTKDELEITAYDWLKIYDYIDDERVFFTSIRDRYSRDVSIVASGTYAGCVQIDSVDATGAFPGIRTELLTEDYLFDYGSEVDGGGSSFAAPGFESGYAFAQAFIPDDSEILGALIRCAYTKDASATEDSVIRVGIKEDDGADRPVADYLFSVDYTLTTTGAQWLFLYFDTTNYTFTRLVPGRKYWLYVAHYSTDAVYPGLYTPYRQVDGSYANTETDAHFVYGLDAPLDDLSSEYAGNLFQFPYLARAKEISPSDYIYSGGNLIITKMRTDYPGLKNPPAVMPTIPQSDDRGRVSYYYATIDAETVMDRLITCGAQFFKTSTTYLTDTDANITKALDVYRTRGKTYGECLRELGDMYSYVSGSTYQCSLCHRWNGSYHYISLAKRLTTADTSVLTLAPGYDSATANHQRIVSADLRRSSGDRPAAVLVVGKDADGKPIYAKRDDATYIASSCLPHTLVEYDSGINTLAEANRRAYDLLDGIDRESWEGTVRISGVYPQLISRSAGSYGSGQIITLTHSKYALSAENFKVTAIEIGNDDTTLVTLSNRPRLSGNWIQRANVMAKRSASLQSPDPETTLYIVVRKSDVVTDSTTYMQLCSADGVILDSHSNYDAHRVLCTQLATPTGMDNYNTYTYHAEFGAENGYGEIERIELYSEATIGSQLAEYDFSSEVGADTEPYKTKYTRIVVDFHCARA